MKYVYPVFIKKDGKFMLVRVPDFDAATQGKDLADAIDMARDLIGLKGTYMEDNGEALPSPSGPEEAIGKEAANTEGLHLEDGLLTYVDVDFDEYRKKVLNRSVRKNGPVPYWLNEQAEKAGVNFSKALQFGLRAFLGIDDPDEKSAR